MAQRRAPLEIVLEYRPDDLQLAAIMHNPSGRITPFLFDMGNAVPQTRLVLTDVRGEEVQSFDIRSPRGTPSPESIAPRPEDWVEAQSPAHVRLYETVFIKRSGRYELRWGPHHYKDIHPGRYQAHVVWTSGWQRSWDPATHTWLYRDDVWTGTLLSTTATVILSP